MVVFKGEHVRTDTLVVPDMAFENAQHARRVSLEVKPCSACGLVKALELFPDSANARTGKSSVCKQCTIARVDQARNTSCPECGASYAKRHEHCFDCHKTFATATTHRLHLAEGGGCLEPADFPSDFGEEKGVWRRRAAGWTRQS